MSDADQIRELTERESCLRGSDVQWTRLKGGLAHITYVVTVDSNVLVVKLLTKEMDQFGLMIPLPHLIFNTTQAGLSGVGARVVASHPDIPAIILEHIDGITLSTSDLALETNIPRLGQAIRELHTRSGDFANRIELFTLMDDYLGLIEKHAVDLPEGLLDDLSRVRDVQRVLDARPLDLVPSNNDLLAANVMDDGSIRLIDYDFSGMNDPMFDVGDLAMEGNYTPEQVSSLCRAYFGNDRPDQCARAQLFGMAAQFTWSLLFIAMSAVLTEMPDDDFDYYAEGVSRWKWAHDRLTAVGFDTILLTAQDPV